MNESSVGSGIRDTLKRRRFTVLKHHDASSEGHPDMSISGMGTTLWVEEKFMGLKNIDLPITLHARQFIDVKRVNQMLVACQLAVDSCCQYWLYIEHKNRAYIAVLKPQDVLYSYMQLTPIVVTQIWEAGKWKNQIFSMREMPKLSTSQ